MCRWKHGPPVHVRGERNELVSLLAQLLLRMEARTGMDPGRPNEAR